MSQQPEPPASIAAAITETLDAEWKRLRAEWTEYEVYLRTSGELVAPEVLARAVWDALLAEGRIVSDAYPDAPPVLVIPLPVVEPRDTEQM